MTILRPQHLPKAVLLDLLPATFEPWGSSGWYPSRPPTSESVARIEFTLRIKLPRPFIEVAASCPSYGGWFGSIGNDFANGNHILSINAALRDAGLAPRYVLLNHGHDGDFNAWDTEEQPNEGEFPIVNFNYEIDRRTLSDLKVSASRFADYIDDLVRARAPRCPVKAMRRRAKRILAAHGRPAPA